MSTISNTIEAIATARALAQEAERPATHKKTAQHIFGYGAPAGTPPRPALIQLPRFAPTCPWFVLW